VRPDTLRAIAKRNDYALPDDLESSYEFRDFAHFLEAFVLTTGALQHYEDFRDLVVAYAGEAKDHGAVYIEAIFAPRILHGLDTDEVFSGYCDGVQEARELHGVEVRLTPDIVRGFPLDEAEQVVRHSAAYRERGIVGVGLGGLEAEFPPGVVHVITGRGSGVRGFFTPDARSATTPDAPPSWRRIHDDNHAPMYPPPETVDR